MSYRFRVPKEGKINDWKETLTYLYKACKWNKYYVKDLEEKVQGTDLQNHLEKLKKED